MVSGTDRGEAHYAFAKNNEISGIICAVVGAVSHRPVHRLSWTQFRSGVSYASCLGVPLYFLYRQTRLDAEKQFDADLAYVAPPAAVPAQ